MSSQPPVEVRQCPKCQQPAVVLVTEWAHDGTNESTRDYRCQSCGALQVKWAKTRVIAYWIVGVLLIVAGIGVPFLYVAWRQQTFDKRIPVVAAPAPRMRFPSGPPKRTCGKCGGIAKALRITRHTHKGLPTGTDYEYVCGQCGLEFATENFLAHVVASLGALVMAGVSAGFFFGARGAGWKWGGGLGMALIAVLLLVQSGVRLMNRSWHKAIEEHVL